MRTWLVLLALSLPAALPVVAHAHGCLKGAAVGGVVGHVAGRHALTGAAVGCVIGHHQAKVRQGAQAPTQPPHAPTAAGDHRD